MSESHSFKHAFLIGAYQNPDYLRELIYSLNSERANFYIHINPDSYKIFKSFVKEITNDKNIKGTVKIIATKKIKYGGTQLLYSIRDLIELAFENPNNHYFHLISGQDLFVSKIDVFERFFDINDNKQYINYNPDLLSPESTFPKHFLKRYQYKHLHSRINCRNKKYLLKINHLLVKAQEILHLKRELPFKSIYVGSGWFSITRGAAKEVVDFINKGYKYIKDTYMPDEMIFQTVLLNSNKDFCIVNNCLRYIDWKSASGSVGSPKTLTIDDYDKIVSSKAFFARKVDPIISKELILKYKTL